MAQYKNTPQFEEDQSKNAASDLHKLSPLPAVEALSLTQSKDVVGTMVRQLVTNYQALPGISYGFRQDVKPSIQATIKPLLQKLETYTRDSDKSTERFLQESLATRKTPLTPEEYQQLSYLITSMYIGGRVENVDGSTSRRIYTQEELSILLKEGHITDPEEFVATEGPAFSQEEPVFQEAMAMQEEAFKQEGFKIKQQREEMLERIMPGWGKLSTSEKKLYRLAFTDGMTGILNYRGYQIAADKVRDFLEETDTSEYLIAVSDGDNFQGMNFLAGFPNGDLIIRGAYGHGEHDMLRELEHIREHGTNSAGEAMTVHPDAEILSIREGAAGEEFTRISVGVSSEVMEYLMNYLRKSVRTRTLTILEEMMEEARSQATEGDSKMEKKAMQVYKDILKLKKNIEITDEEVGGSTYVIQPVTVSADNMGDTSSELDGSESHGVRRMKMAKNAADHKLTLLKNSHDPEKGVQGKNMVKTYEARTLEQLLAEATPLTGTEKQLATASKIREEHGVAIWLQSREIRDSFVNALLELFPELEQHSEKLTTLEKTLDYMVTDPLRVDITIEELARKLGMDPSFDRDSVTALKEEAVNARIEYLRLLSSKDTKSFTHSPEKMQERVDHMNAFNDAAEEGRETPFPYLRFALKIDNVKPLNETLGHEGGDAFAGARAAAVNTVLQERNIHGMLSSTFTSDEILVEPNTYWDMETLTTYFNKVFILDLLAVMDKQFFEHEGFTDEVDGKATNLHQILSDYCHSKGKHAEAEDKHVIQFYGYIKESKK